MDFILEGLGGAIARIVSLDPDLLAAASTSLAVSGTATLLSIIVGIPLGAVLGLARFPGRTLALSLANTGMGLPPVVVGLFVVVFIWRSGPLGDLGAYCTREAMVAAQFLLAFPTVVGLTAVAVQSLDPMLRVQVSALGATPAQTMWILVREAKLPILTAAMAGFGAVISEIGASMMTGCNIKGDTRILTTAIALEATGTGRFDLGFAYAFALLALIFGVNAVTTWAQQRRRPL
jgi:tungstate transport system permease protein